MCEREKKQSKEIVRAQKKRKKKSTALIAVLPTINCTSVRVLYSTTIIIIHSIIGYISNCPGIK